MSDTGATARTQRALLIRAEQIYTLYSQLPKSTAGIILGGLIVGAAMWHKIEHAHIAAWFGLMCANQAWRLYLFRRYRKAQPPPQQARRWAAYWAIGAGISGAIWGAAGIFMFVPGSPEYQALVVIALVGVTAGALMLITMHKPSFYAFVLPTLLPVTVRLALEGDAAHGFLAAIVVAVLAAILGFGRTLNDVFTQSLEMRYENLDLITELTEQKRLADRARQEAESATRAKSQFLAAASHDLRQPLHAMGLFAAALSEKNRSPEEMELVNSINASVVALERLFNELLDISKLDSGVVQPNIEPFALQPLLDQMRTDYEPAAAEKGLRLRIRASRAVVASDRVLLERIVRNLLSNAIRYTRAGGVLLGCRPRTGGLRIEVWDTGVGIAEAEREHIFEEFYQVGDAGRHSKKGLGLGLAIIRRLCALLDYRVELKSRLGRGSVFAVTVPLGALAPAPSLQAPAAPRAADDLDGRLVVVVDDEEAILAGMKSLLTRWGCEVVLAANTAEALDGLGRITRYPDLIIADFRLQDRDTGIDTIERLRDELGSPIPAILATGSLTPDLEVKAQHHDFTLINKPVTPDKLREVIGAKLRGA